ncbi:MAG: hypothetical protein J0I52_13215 [Bordetella sp.]|nr:hypothetical protein [Bordetella sp.]
MRWPEAIVIAAALSGCTPSKPSDRSFDPVAWRSAQLDDSTRGEMVDDLLATKRLAGLTQAEVIDLLGPPTEATNFDRWNLVYPLGPCRDCRFPIDPSWLVIRLTDGRVVESRTIEG